MLIWISSTLGSSLLLIDDVWSSPTWQIIKRYFPDNENGSRIIVTTRFPAVATTCCVDEDSDIVHRVKVLSDDDSKPLFQKSLFECRVSGDNIPDSLENVWGLTIGHSYHGWSRGIHADDERDGMG